MIVYLQIQSASPQELRSDSFLKRINVANKTADLPVMLPEILSLFAVGESKLTGAMQDKMSQEEIVDARDLTTRTLHRLAHDSFSLWKETIIAKAAEH